MRDVTEQLSQYGDAVEQAMLRSRPTAATQRSAPCNEPADAVERLAASPDQSPTPADLRTTAADVLSPIPGRSGGHVRHRFQLVAVAAAGLLVATAAVVLDRSDGSAPTTIQSNMGVDTTSIEPLPETPSAERDTTSREPLPESPSAERLEAALSALGPEDSIVVVEGTNGRYSWTLTVAPWRSEFSGGRSPSEIDAPPEALPIEDLVCIRLAASDRESQDNCKWPGGDTWHPSFDGIFSWQTHNAPSGPLQGGLAGGDVFRIEFVDAQGSVLASVPTYRSDRIPTISFYATDADLSAVQTAVSFDESGTEIGRQDFGAPTSSQN